MYHTNYLFGGKIRLKSGGQYLPLFCFLNNKKFTQKESGKMAFFLNNARGVLRTVAEAVYEAKCTVICSTKSKDYDGATIFEDTTICENEPCRLSHSGFGSTSNTNTLDAVSANIKMFIRPEVQIPEGSKIIITQYGVTDTYHMSSKPVVFVSHQEISLELEKEYA